jgi:acyl dehydratase
VAELAAALGRELGPTDWFPVDQSRVDSFGEDTEDRQWIHVDVERSASGPFGGTVAHGFLTLALVPYFMSQLRRVEGAKMAVNYGLDRVRFPAPVLVGSRIRAWAVLRDLRPLADGAVQVVTLVSVEVEGGSKPACVAEQVGRYYF